MIDWKKKVLDLYQNEGYRIKDIVPVIRNMYPEEFGSCEYRKLYNRIKRMIYRENEKATKTATNTTNKEDKAENKNFVSSVSYKENGQVESDKLIEIYNASDITPEFLLEKHGFDKTKWKIVSYKNNYWNAQGKDNQKLIMLQSKIVVKPYEGDTVSPYWVQEWLNDFEIKPVDYSLEKKKKDTNEVLLLPIVDLHYNLFTSTFSNVENYDCNIATSNLYKVINDVLERTAKRKFHKIIIPLGNDLFNANGINNTTFKGTPQINEIDMRKAYINLFTEMTSIISILEKIAPVDIIFIPSNHDKEITFYFLYNLYTIFKNDKKVNVDYSPIVNKYYKFGNTLMMFSHDANINKVSNIVMDEAKDIIDNTDYIEVFLAHLHHETVNNERNITIRRLPTMVSPSDWTTEKGYRSNKVSQSFIISETDGISDIIYTRV